MRKFNDYLREQMQNPELKKEYDNLQPEFDIIRAIVDARTSQNLTQKQLAEKTGIHQADISKLENGTRNPSINLLKRLAEGMDMMLKIEFVPKQKSTLMKNSNYSPRRGIVRVFGKRATKQNGEACQ